MMMMSHLPEELVEEILSRIPLTSLKAVRSTCKKWNALTKNQTFTDKHIDKATTSNEKQFLVIRDYKACLIGINLHGIANNIDISIKGKGKLITLDNSDEQFRRTHVFHCNGLLLCVYETMLVVWNPYCGIPKSIERRYKNGISVFALGYDQSCGSHKILRLFGPYQKNLEIYYFSSDSWMVPSVTLEWDITSMEQGVSLKGNTYWYARDTKSTDYYLLSFDFTKERFGPRLPLPFSGYNVSLSTVKDERLALLFKRWDILKMEIWVTNKIEPDAVSWSYFLKVDMTLPLKRMDFLIDEDKKVAVFFDIDNPESFRRVRNVACIIGEDGYFKKLDLGKTPDTNLCSLGCSYVPSSMQIK